MPSDGVRKISSTFYSLGPLAKSVQDLYDLYKVLVEDELGQIAVPPLFTTGFQNLTVDPSTPRFGTSEMIIYIHLSV